MPKKSLPAQRRLQIYIKPCYEDVYRKLLKAAKNDPDGRTVPDIIFQSLRKTLR